MSELFLPEPWITSLLLPAVFFPWLGFSGKKAICPLQHAGAVFLFTPLLTYVVMIVPSPGAPPQSRMFILMM